MFYCALHSTSGVACHLVLTLFSIIFLRRNRCLFLLEGGSFFSDIWPWVRVCKTRRPQFCFSQETLGDGDIGNCSSRSSHGDIRHLFGSSVLRRGSLLCPGQPAVDEQKGRTHRKMDPLLVLLWCIHAFIYGTTVRVHRFVVQFLTKSFKSITVLLITITEALSYFSEVTGY